MLKNWLWLLCLTTSPFLVGQSGPCPTVDEAADRLVSVSWKSLRKEAPSCVTLFDTLSIALHRGSVTAYKAGNYPLAISVAESAVQMHKEWQAAGGTPALNYGKALYNLGLFHLRTGSIARAEAYFDGAAAAYARIDHPQATRRRLTAMTDAGVASRDLGDYTRATERLTAVLNDPAIGDYPYNYVLTNQRLADVYRNAGRFTKAARALEENQSRLEELGEANTPYAYGLNIDLAGVYYSQQQYDRVEALLKTLQPVLEDLPVADNKRVRSLQVANAVKKEDWSTAEKHFEANNEYIRAHGRDDDALAINYSNGGEIASNEGRFNEALDRTQQSISLLLPNFDFNEEQIVPPADLLREGRYTKLLFTHLSDLANVYYQNNQLEEALTVTTAAATLVDDLRNNLTDAGSQLFWREELRPLYERAISICAQTNQPERAYDYFERARAILLLEGLLVSDRRTSLPDSVANRLKTQEARIADLRLNLVDNDSTYAQYADSLTTALATLSSLREETAAQFPNTIRARTDVETTDLATLATALAANNYAASVQYFFGEKNTYVLTIEATTGAVELIDLGDSEKLRGKVEECLKQITAEGDKVPDPLAAELYGQVVARLSLPATGKLLLVPDGPLAFLPFAALPANSQGSYLLENYELTYAQSATVWNYQLQQNKGPNAVKGYAPFTDRSQPNAPQLTASTKELEALQDYFNATTYASTQADQATILSDLPKAGVLHLATHAFASATDEVPPRILTADAPIHLRDLYSQTTKAELVTLSACNSNLGQDARGEGVLSLGRAFSAAGATGVVASLWAVNDQATAAIMTTFYRELADGADRPAALQTAQLEYLRDPNIPSYLKAPKYWAAFNYYGAPGPLSVASSGLSPLLTGLLICLLATFGFTALTWFRRRSA